MMMVLHGRPLLWAFLLVQLFGAMAHADYFLHGDQKIDLITHGEINGDDQARYNVWIVPGYYGPAHDAKEGWSDAGHDVSAYGHSDLYKDALHTGKNALKFSGKDAIGHFAFKGSYKAWAEAMGAASARTQKRVFGWWFAYPWAVIEATGESLVRVGLGVPGGIIIGGVGSTVVPVAELAWPALKGVYHSTIPGTVLPIAASAWNTIIAPPLAMLGQQPNADRADGFWLKRIDPRKTDHELIAVQAALVEWRMALMSTTEVKVVRAEEEILHENYNKNRESTLKQLQAQYEADRAQQKIHWQQIMSQQAALHAPELAAKVDRQKLIALVQRYGRSTMINSLSGSGLSQKEASTLLAQLIGNEPGEHAVPQNELRRDNDRTDPLKRSLQLGTETF